MAKYGDPNTATGKAFVAQQLPTTATVLALPIVLEEDLKKAKSTINTARLSGKQRGAMVLMEKQQDKSLHIAVADGPMPTDSWNVVQLDVAVNPSE
jgi:hypothetical protein|nr:MAG TPA: hypothetical protein [Caudoviricetes sp.]